MKNTLFVIFVAMLLFGSVTLFAQTESVYHEMAGYYRMKEVTPGVHKLIRTETRAYFYYETHGSKLIEASAGKVGGFWDGRWHEGPQLIHIQFTGGLDHWYVKRLHADTVLFFEVPRAVLPKSVSKSWERSEPHGTVVR